jgi:hypothetical protein
MVTRKSTLVIYVVAIIIAIIILFIVGLLIVQISFINEKLSLDNRHDSILSGLSLASWPILLIMLAMWWKSRKYERTIGKKSLLLSTVILLSFSISLYPPIMLLIGYWNSPLLTHTNVTLSYAGMTTFASFQVYLLALNSNYRGAYRERDEIIKLLLTSTTLVSLASVALTFVLSNSGYLDAMTSSYQRAVVTGAYCLIPIATYCLGYLAKLLRVAVAEGVGLALSLILSFVIGASILSIMRSNGFFFSAIIPLFLIVGLFLALYEKGKGLSNLSK